MICAALTGGFVTIEAMPNIASVLKSEISRIARKEVRSETQTLKKAVITHRSEIAALKRRAAELEQQLRRATKNMVRAAPPPISEDSGRPPRVSAKAIASVRRRLGLSAEGFGRLLGASGQSVYNWEAGKAKPRTKHLVKIASLRRVGKGAVAAYLVAMPQ